MQTSRRVLPPGIEDDVVFGILWIQALSLKSSHLRNIPPVHVQFWGQSTPTPLSPRTPQEYQIKCPVTLFSKYLLDMRQNLKVQVEGLGMVPIDLSSRLKDNIGIDSKSPFDHFQGFFPVLDSKNKKKASLELEFCCTFNPDIALRQLAQDQEQPEDQQLRPKSKPTSKTIKTVTPETKGEQKEQSQKQALGSKVGGSQQDSRCPSLKVNSLDVLAVQKPQLLCEFYQESKQKKGPTKVAVTPPPDRRLPHSLDNEPNTGQFEPQKYQPLPNTPSKKSFPMVEKVLTYSNLRLSKEEEDAKVKEEIRKGSVQAEETKMGEERVKGLGKEVREGQIEEEMKREGKEEGPLWSSKFKKEDIIKQQSQPQAKQDRPKRSMRQEQASVQIKQIVPVSHPKIEAQLFPDNHPAPPQEEVSLSQLSEVKKVQDSVSVQAKKQILSRVVHLDQELHKELHQQIPLREVKPLPNVFPTRASPNFNQPRKAPKKSGLLLSMVVEVQRDMVYLPARRFWLRFRPYGEKQFLKMGPDFESTITLLFPVAEPQVLRMNKIPFLLQFWAGEQQFVGLVKLSLSKVHAGFVLDGRLNEVAVKTSLTPTVIHKGVMAVRDLSDAAVGEAHISAYIGTTAQLQAHLSAPRPSPLGKRPSEAVRWDSAPAPSGQKKEQEQKVRPDGNLQSLSLFLQAIVSSAEASRLLLSNLEGKDKLDRRSFDSLFDGTNGEGDSPYSVLQRSGAVQAKEILLCLEDYQSVVTQLAKKITEEASKVPSQILPTIISGVEKGNKLNFIHKTALKQTTETQRYLPTLLSLLPQFTSTPILLSWLRSPLHHPAPEIKLSHQETIFQELSTLFLERGHVKQLQSLLGEADSLGSISFDRLREVLVLGDKKWSIWLLGVLLEGVYQDSGEQYGGQGKENSKVNAVLLYNWVICKGRNREESLKQERAQIEKKKELQREIREEQIIPKRKHSESPFQEPKQQNLNEVKEQTLKYANDNNTSKEKPFEAQPSRSKIEENSNKQQLPSEKALQHTFILELQQLHLNQVSPGPSHLTYQFPLEDQPIPHPPLQLQPDKHTYHLAGQSSHSLTLTRPILEHLADHPLTITLNSNGNTLQGHLHPAQLVQEESKITVVPLFHPEMSGIQGKVKLTLNYQVSEAESEAVGRQTTQDLFLPKSGQLHFIISVQVDPLRVKQTLALPSEESYLQLTLDIFGSSPQLAPHFPPVKSQLTLPLVPLTMEGVIPVTLSPNVLEQFRSGSWSLVLSAVYYIKEGGNYQCKHAVLGNSSAPLLSAIKPSGLVGDYALKNRLGMFLALAHVNLSYRKKTVQDRPIKSPSPSSNQSIWLVLQFPEVINFQQELHWMKLQILHQGKRVSSQRQTLKGIGVLPFNKAMVLQLDSQELSTTKILPIRVATGQGLFAIDINLRPMIEHFQNNKIYAQGGYLLVVDSQARPTRLRLATKVFAFKGSHAVAPLAEALATRGPFVLDEEMKDYGGKMEMLRKHLRIPLRLMEQCLTAALLPDPKQELSPLFFTNTVLPGLELTPIVSDQPETVEDMVTSLPPISSEEEVLDFLQEREVRLWNFRKQFLGRFSFGKLGSSKIDQNIEYLGLSQQIDTVVLAKTIRIQDKEAEEECDQSEKGALVTIVKGHDFHLLYNGITPNPLISFPTLRTHSPPQTRTQHPLFNLPLPLKQIPPYLPIEVYHSPGEEDSDILIGEGSLNLRDCIGKGKKLYRAVIVSVMSSRMQAGVDFKVEPLRAEMGEGDLVFGEEDRKEEMWVEDEVIEAALARLKEDRRPKEPLFESSDEEY